MNKSLITFGPGTGHYHDHDVNVCKAYLCQE